ncbi:Outer membrane protein (porin) [Marinobacter daqiaonensis]|uniref:Outer membrane protein (Porin) n=1 Tax=Marinobacter daqiaonensis TaxID=650891 RepID=A0A1I6JTS7_9GAMM|nr:porin [Marinobacter daqiaonensis]SFR82321.1 Outer membrane protein (porin) [Marinobacter daqiaonensis]
MKKQLLALAIGSLVAAPSLVLADKGPTVYGKVNITYENVDDGTDDQWELRSNASRIGVKGTLDLDIQNVQAIYQAEFQMDVDDGNRGDNNVFSQRNIYGGFRHANLGTLIAGKFDTPLKKAQMDVDQFGDLAADIGAIVDGEERLSNIIQYSTPKLVNAVTLNLAMIPGEGSTRAGEVRDGAADAFSSSLVFDSGTFYGALAYDSEVPTTVYDADFAGVSSADYTADAVRLTGGARIQNFEIGALYQMSETSDDVAGVSYEDSSYVLSGAVKLSRWKLKAQYGLTDLDQSDDDLTLMALGADYKVGDKSKIFTYYANVEADDAALEDTNFGVGFEHKFSM